MPRERIQLRPRQDYHTLVELLVAELEAGDAGTAGGPRIIEEELPANRLYVTVIWPEWAQVPPEDRGRIILDAYKVSSGIDRALAIGAALGLTPDEATRIGINAAA